MRYDVFVNYFDDPHRDSPLNLAVARVILGAYLIWKTVWYDWQAVVATPFVGSDVYAFAVPQSFPLVLTVEKWLLFLGLIAVMVGYRLRITAFVSALLLAHLETVRFTLNTSGATTAAFFSVYFLIFFALYAEEDHLSADGVRRTGRQKLSDLRSFLKAEDDGTYAMHPLKWSLLAMAVVYFGAGLDKVLKGGMAWLGAENLTRIVRLQHAATDLPTDLGLVFIQFPLLVQAASIGTLALELGLLVALVAGLSLTPFVVGLLGLHLGIMVTMGMLFFDPFPIFAMALAWDAGFARLARDRQITVVFDEHCYFCSRSLHPFKLLDVTNSIDFRSQYDVPEEYRARDDVNFEDAMYVFAENGRAYRGYYAFREVLRQNRAFAPLVWIMTLGPAEQAGTGVYEYIAQNRSRHFTCAIDEQ